MATTITKSKHIPDCYYINTRGILLSNWDFHQKGSTFTEQEKNDFNSYLDDLQAKN